MQPSVSGNRLRRIEGPTRKSSRKVIYVSFVEGAHHVCCVEGNHKKNKNVLSYLGGHLNKETHIRATPCSADSKLDSDLWDGIFMGQGGLVSHPST